MSVWRQCRVRLSLYSSWATDVVLVPVAVPTVVVVLVSVAKARSVLVCCYIICNCLVDGDAIDDCLDKQCLLISEL